MYFRLFVGVLCLSLFCFALLCDHSSEEEEKAGLYEIINIKETFIFYFLTINFNPWAKEPTQI